MSHDPDLLAQQQRRRRLQTALLWIPWALIAIILALLAVRPHIG